MVARRPDGVKGPAKRAESLRRFGRSRRLGGLLLLGRLGALARPRLVELDAPLAVLALLDRQPRPERPAVARLEARDRFDGAAVLHQLAGHRGRELLAGLALPDHEPAAR